MLSDTAPSGIFAGGRNPVLDSSVFHGDDTEVRASGAHLHDPYDHKGTTQLQDDFFFMFQESGLAADSADLELTGLSDPISSIKAHGGGGSRLTTASGSSASASATSSLDASKGKRRWPESAGGSGLVSSPPGVAGAGAGAVGNDADSAVGDDDRSGKKSKKSSRSSAVEKKDKGLRQFSWKVCQKVEEKGRTTYNQVADELVAEFSNPAHACAQDQAYDEKNIRRRVYDALNVLMAMDIIAKEKKDIRWKGFPANAEKELESLKVRGEGKIDSIQQKQTRLEELLLQFISLKNLLKRNEGKEYCQSTTHRIYVPYVIVNTATDTLIQCDFSEDRQSVSLELDKTFELHDDVEVLNNLKMYKCTQEELGKLIPPQLVPFVTDRRPEVISADDGGLR